AFGRDDCQPQIDVSIDKDLEGAPVLSLLKYAEPTLKKTKRGAIRSLVETDAPEKVSRRIATAIYWDMLFLVTSDVHPFRLSQKSVSSKE
ncbi:MAG: hypothetical protein AAF399_28190, partial [Bacteroidota bacterium]